LSCLSTLRIEGFVVARQAEILRISSKDKEGFVVARQAEILRISSKDKEGFVVAGQAEILRISYCLVLVGSRNEFERYFTIKLK